MTLPPADGDVETQDPLEKLLDREAPTDYLEAWVRSLRQSMFSRLRQADHEAVLFRLGDQWLALDLRVLVEVHEFAPVRTVPGRTNDMFRGLVNLRGELHLCADLHALAGVDTTGPEPVERRSPTSRLLVLEENEGRWTCEVDAVRGVERYSPSDLIAPQVTVAKSLGHVTDGLIRFGDLLAARVAAPRLFEAFRRSLRP